LHSFALDFCPLEIYVFAIAIYRIVIATQKFALIGHH